MIAALDIDAAWPEAEYVYDTDEPSGVRVRKEAPVEAPPQRAPAAKPPLPREVHALRYLRARFELEDRMDAGERVRVEVDGEVYELVMVADSIAPSGEVRRRGGIRVERVT